jgi:hypothetical protein
LRDFFLPFFLPFFFAFFAIEILLKAMPAEFIPSTTAAAALRLTEDGIGKSSPVCQVKLFFQQ